MLLLTIPGVDMSPSDEVTVGETNLGAKPFRVMSVSFDVKPDGSSPIDVEVVFTGPSGEEFSISVSHCSEFLILTYLIKRIKLTKNSNNCYPMKKKGKDNKKKSSVRMACSS